MGDIDTLFFKVWRNCYIQKEMFTHLRLFKKYNVITFKSKKELQEFQYHQYVDTMVYYAGEKLVKGDIDNRFTQLKTIEISHDRSCNGDVIPFGVEKIIFPFYNSTRNLKILSTLPNSVHSIENLCAPSKDIVFPDQDSEKYRPIKSYMFQSSIKEIIFSGGSFNAYIDKISSDTFPSTLTSIELGYNWNNGDVPLKKGDFRKGILKLIIDGYNQELVVGAIPSTVTNLHIGFPNKTLKPRAIPSSVKTLTITDSKGNSPIVKGSIPNTVESLTISNEGLEIQIGALQSNCSLTYLETLSPMLNGIIEIGMLPNGLKELILHREGNQVKCGALPSSLTKLDYTTNEIEKGFFLNCNNSLTELNLFVDKIGIGYLPESLKKLNLIITGGDTHEYIEEKVEEDDIDIHTLKKGMIPYGVEELVISMETLFKVEIGAFPSTIKSIEFTNGLNFDFIQGILPNSIESIIFPRTSYPFSVGSLPLNLKKLVLSDSFYQSLDQVGVLPSTLEYLEFQNKNYDKPITKQNVLPPSLKIILLPKKMKPWDTNSFISKDSIHPSVTNIINYVIKYSLY